MNMNIYIQRYSASDCHLIKSLNYTDTSAHSMIAQALCHAITLADKHITQCQATHPRLKTSPNLAMLNGDSGASDPF